MPSHPTAKLLLLPAAVLAAYFYVTNITASVQLDTRLHDLHGCLGTPTVRITDGVKTSTSQMCTEPMDAWEFVKLSARYISSTAVLVGIAIYFAFVSGI
jgi:hypothetical protein